jgi:hypothetical protein
LRFKTRSWPVDQQSTTEKNHQVQMMADIYKAAREVIIWLDSKDTTEAVNNLVQLIQAGPSSASGVVCDLKLSEWTAVWMFRQSTYWTRLWVVQEILLA